MAEIEIENLINNLPNLLDESLYRPPGEMSWTKGKLGEVNVFLRQEPLRECSGVLDICFVTNEVVHLAELKDDAISLTTLDQYNKYLPVIKATYPRHKIQGYLVGKWCVHRTKLKSLIGEQSIKIKLFPNPNFYTHCNYCGAGVHALSQVCSICRHPPNALKTR
jgi:hypothetical protein